ncbi:MAG: monovalent cation/H+ antiporter complex subunit F [Planctomycetota bacterium]|jgi:multicomponent Na+:H+ antiporter subunit F
MSIFDVLLALLAVALFLCFLRLLLGPSLADRVSALDTLPAIGLVMLVVYAIEYDLAVLLDLAIVIALISFVGTLAFAKHMERRKAP